MKYMQKDDVLRRRSYDFAIRTVNMVKFLREYKCEYVLCKQVLRSGTAIGALVSEGEFAQSSADFVNKLNVALKEANETKYWLNLLHDTEYIEQEAFESMENDCNALIAILVASIKTLKSKLSNSINP